MNESGWLLERIKRDGTVFAPAEYFGEGSHLHMTTDHMKAVRFSRKEDAERLKAILSDTLPIFTFPKEMAATEHQWDVGPRSSDN